MKKELQKKVKEALENVEIDLDLTSESMLNEELKMLADDIENADKSYILSLDEYKLYLKFSNLFMDEDPNRSKRFAKKSLRLEKSYEGFVLKGNAEYKLGDFKGAVGSYSDALDYKKEKLAHHYKAKALMNRGKDERALESLSKAWEEEQDPDIMGLYADALVDLGRVDEAKKYYDRAEKIEGTEYKNKKVDEILESAKEKSLPKHFDRIIALDRNCIEAWLGKADRLWNLGEKDEAVEVLEEAVEKIDDETISKKLEYYRTNITDTVRCEVCSGTGKCSTCEGTGDCENCGGTGNCEGCQGSGYCYNCDGSTECPECDGTGKSGWFSKCDTCGGDGICVECKGHGMCEICDGTGECTLCKGNGNCKDCQGSGSCPNCDGEGVILKNEGY